MLLARPPISIVDRSNNVTNFKERASRAAVVRPASHPPIITTSELSTLFDIGYSFRNLLLSIALLSNQP